MRDCQNPLAHDYCTHTGADHASIPGNKDLPTRAGRPNKAVPVHPEMNHASCVGWNHPYAYQVDQITIK